MMIKFAIAICAIAAMIFIGQFIFGFYQASNDRAAAKQAQFEEIVRERTKRIANGG